MSVHKERSELLGQLIASLTGQAPGHIDAQLARSAKEALDFHTFLDTHPDVVAAELAQLGERLEDAAQFDKAAALGSLTARLRAAEQPSAQRDFAARQLSFLLAASRNVLRTLVDPAAVASVPAAPPPPEAHPSEWSDETDDVWWANDYTFSPDQLSAWSGEEDSEEGEEGEEGGWSGDDAGAAAGTPPKAPPAGAELLLPVADPAASPLTPLALPRAALRSPRPGRGRPPLTPSSRRLRHPYGPTSLSVWLAAKASAGHPSRAIDPRRCFTEADLSAQVLNSLKGLAAPGLAFRFDPASGCYRASRGVHTADLPPATAAALLGRFARLASQLRRVQAFCDAVVFTGAGAGGADGGAAQLRGLPTVAALAAAVAEQVLAARGQLVELEEVLRAAPAQATLLSLHLRLAVTGRQVAALDGVVGACRWRGGAVETAAAALDALEAALAAELMHPAAHGGAVAALLGETFCAAWRPLAAALDDWVLRGSLEAAPPEFFVVKTEGEAFWSDGFALRRREDGGVATPRLLAPLAEELLRAGLATMGLRRQGDAPPAGGSAPPPLYDDFCAAVTASLQGEAQSAAGVPSDRQTEDLASPPTGAAPSSSDRGDAHACAQEWSAAVARSAADAVVPAAEDIADLVALPPTPLALPAAGSCPAAAAFDEGAEGWAAAGGAVEGAGQRQARHPIAAAMQLAAAERARRAAAGRSGAAGAGLLPAPPAQPELSGDPKIVLKGDSAFNLPAKEVCELDGGPWAAMFERAAAGLGTDALEPLAVLPPRVDAFHLPHTSELAGSAAARVPHEAGAWAAALPLAVLADRALLAPLRSRASLAGRAACDAVRGAGLAPQLASLRALALAAGPAVEPIADLILSRCSTPAGVDGLSVFDLNAALADAIEPGTPGGLVGLAAARATVAQAPPPAGPQAPAPSVASLRRVQLALEPAFPLSLVASGSFLGAHTALCTLSLQLRWVERSLVAARVGAWKAGKRALKGGPLAPATRKAQQEMLVLVAAARGHLAAAVGAAGARLERALASAATLDDVMVRCREYEAALRQQGRFWAGETALGGALAGALHAALRHSVLTGQARRAAAALAQAHSPAPTLSSAASEALLASFQLDGAAAGGGEGGGGEAAAEAAQQRLDRVRAALEATEREFEGHRAALVGLVAAEGGQAGAHSAAAAALLAAVDAGRRAGP